MAGDLDGSFAHDQRRCKIKLYLRDLKDESMCPCDYGHECRNSRDRRGTDGVRRLVLLVNHGFQIFGEFCVEIEVLDKVGTE